MSEQRFCDMCLQPYAGRGDRSSCTQDCPLRRGLTRGSVVNQLVRGLYVQGVHLESPWFQEAKVRLLQQAQTITADIEALQAQVAELQNRLRGLEQRKEEICQILLGLAFYDTADHDANQRSNSSQLESEPAEGDA